VQEHASRIATEIDVYKDNLNIHDLPEIFHYWSNKHLGPHIKDVFDTENVHAVMADELRASTIASGNPYMISIGAGDGQVEMGIAERLLQSGFNDFEFVCVELNPHLIQRGMAAAAEKGLQHKISFQEADLSTWRCQGMYGAAFAHHSLHHIVALESVFDELAAHMAPRASFVTADMIGRNGHMRWPEVLQTMEQLWASMPPRYKYHHLWRRVVDPYENWDCSGQSFEGIRAQDIMPELVKRFHFRKMCVWGGALDLLIDRGYGHNLDPKSPQDTAFIDYVWEMDCECLRARKTTPTQICAVMTKEPGTLRSTYGLTAEECIRRA